MIKTAEFLTQKEASPGMIRRSEHLLLFALFASVVIGSFLLQPTPEGGLRLPLPFVEDLRLPAICTSRLVLGISCPGCGLTRSFAAFAHGDWRGAFRCNPMGPVLFIICVAQIPYRIMEYLGVAASVAWWSALKTRFDLITWFVVAGLVSQWIVRLIV